MSIDHNMDVQYQRVTLQTEGACLCQPISWSIAGMLGNAAAAAIVVVHTRPQAMPLAMKTLRKFIRGFLFLSHMRRGLRLAALRAARAPL